MIMSSLDNCVRWEKEKDVCKIPKLLCCKFYMDK